MIDGPSEEEHDSLAEVKGDHIDPDPFSIGIAIFAALAGGGAFLEARRQRMFIERQHQERFRATWYAARRALINFERVLDEFETYVNEDGYGTQSFRIGSVRLQVDRGRHQALRRLKGQALTTANVMSDTLDDLSEFLGPDYQEKVQEVLGRLADLRIPESYNEVISAGRKAKQAYTGLLDLIGEREGFNREA